VNCIYNLTNVVDVSTTIGNTTKLVTTIVLPLLRLQDPFLREKMQASKERNSSSIMSESEMKSNGAEKQS
jgi:hypothetical protein